MKHVLKKIEDMPEVTKNHILYQIADIVLNTDPYSETVVADNIALLLDLSNITADLKG